MRGIFRDAFRFGEQYIRRAFTYADEFSKLLPTENPKEPPETSNCLQNCIYHRCPTFDLIFSNRPVKDQDLKNWVKNWELMTELLAGGNNAREVVVTCFNHINSADDPDDACVRKVAVIYPAGSAASSNIAQPTFDFRGGDFAQSQVINLCTRFFNGRRLEDIQLDHLYEPEDITNRANLFTLGGTAVNTWIHELTHLGATFVAPYNREWDVVDPNDIIELVQDTGFPLTRECAEQNALFAGWAWFNTQFKDIEDFRYMTWQNPLVDRQNGGDYPFPQPAVNLEDSS